MHYTKKRWGDSFFLRVFASITLVSFAIIVILSIILASRSTNAAFSQISAATANRLESAGKSVESQYRGLQQLYSILNTDADIYAFLNLVKPDKRINIQAENKGRKFKHVHAAIESILLFNTMTDEQIIVGTKFPISSDEFIQNSAKTTSGKLVPQVFDTAGGKVYVLVMPFCHKTVTSGNVTGGIVFYLNAEELLNNAIISDENIDFADFAIDDSGLILLHTDETQIAQTFAIPEVMKEIPSTGSVTLGSKVITYSRNPHIGITFVSIRPYDSVAGVINRELGGVILICALMLLCAGVSGYVISMKLYSPIRVISNTIEDYHKQTQSSGSGGSELLQIIEAFDASLSQIKALQAKSLENSDILKKNALRVLLMSDTGETAQSTTEFSVSFENLFVATINIDRYATIPSERRDMLDTVLCALVNDTAKDEFASETVPLFGGEFVLLMNFRNNQKNNFPMLIQKLNQIHDVILHSLNVSVTIALGGVGNSEQECRAMYKRANDMAQQRFILGYGKVITKKLLEEYLVDNLSFSDELEERLLNSLRLCRRNNFETLLDGILGMIRRCSYPDAIVRLLQLMLSCTKAVRQLPGGRERGWPDVREFMRMEAIEDARAHLIFLFDEYKALSQECAKNPKDKHSAMVDSAKEYIDLHYANTELSAEMLAEQAGYSTNYFSRLFKERTGGYILDYIRKVRINRAKVLLQEGDMKIKAISECTGFISENYFYAAFKKEVGMTPSSFRDLMLKEHDE